eukprot:TRINITY_DN10834_c0_g1_i1.p2 TRINITY_DN10834_c0_g1~~TRINITY_DN10834_c0_g1_i1.p2  ORF type:complete len:180 (+),score=35.10 TRINITY_DN10834_c0_g1_i1:296-835(+)
MLKGQYKRLSTNKLETPRNVQGDILGECSLRKNLKQSRNAQGKVGMAHTVKHLGTGAKGSVQIIKTEVKSPATRNLGKTVLSKQFTADTILDCKSLNEVVVDSFRPGAKLILKNLRTMLSEGSKAKCQKSNQLETVATKVKEIIDKYKTREKLLINENKRLRNRIKQLVKNLAVYEKLT